MCTKLYWRCWLSGFLEIFQVRGHHGRTFSTAAARTERLKGARFFGTLLYLALVSEGWVFKLEARGLLMKLLHVRGLTTVWPGKCA